MTCRRLIHGASVAWVAGALALSAGPAAAHIVLSQKTFEAGTNFAAFFKVEHGCDGSPTLSLRIDIPGDVVVLELPPTEGWTTNTERVGGKIKAVSWRGRLEGGQADQFGVLLKLPARTGAIYFPTVQRCAKGEMRWTEIPVGIQTAKDLKRPAPAVELTAAVEHPAMYVAGDMMVLQPWSRATPPGATTGAGYLTVMNHGSSADTLLGGSTPLAAKFELHQTSMNSGIITMRPVPEGVTIPPGATVTLKPEGGGYHIMLSGLKTPLKMGSRLPVTLNFAKAGHMNVEFSVEAIGALAPATHDEHNQPPR